MASGHAAKVSALLARARRSLADSSAGALEAEVLLAHVLGVGRVWLFANPDERPTADQVARFDSLLERRAGGEPLAYILGRREFWSLSLIVTPDVLIPRPETELLVEAALDFIPADADWRVADLGTGSGAVAAAIAHERPRCEVHATDISAAALKVAARNVEALVPNRVRLHQGSWLEPLSGLFDVIVSNPPYVAEGDPHLAQGDCRFEPRTVLTAGPDGMEAITEIAGAALPCLQPGGLLAVEHGCDQGEAVRTLLRGRGYRRVQTRQDLEGKDRVTFGQT